jgi:XTP/dITP diphosphohydrolase
LVPYVVEEVFELVEALESGSPDDVKEELGDVLYQVLFHADIAAHATDSPFTIDDVAAAVDEKMRVRHPHVFAEGDAKSVDEVVARWDEIKKEQKSHRESVVEGIPEKLSALARAASVLKRSKDILPAPTPEDSRATTEEELGEQLLAIVANARAQGLDAERALRQATRNWEDRVRAAEQASRNGVQDSAES